MRRIRTTLAQPVSQTFVRRLILICIPAIVYLICYRYTYHEDTDSLRLTRLDDIDLSVSQDLSPSLIEWRIGQVPEKEQVVIGASWESGKIRLNITVITNPLLNTPCIALKNGCTYRFYVSNKDEITGGNYLVRDPLDRFRYSGHVFIYEIGSQHKSWFVEVLRLRELSKTDTVGWNWDLNDKHSDHSLYQAGVVVTQRGAKIRFTKSIWKKLKQVHDELGLELEIHHTIIKTNLELKRTEWLEKFAKLPLCSFKNDGSPAWQESSVSWVKKQLLVDRGIHRDDLLGDANYVWFPRTCRLPKLKRNYAIERFGVPDSKRGSEIVLIGTSRIRHMFSYLPSEFGVESERIHLQSEVEKLHDKEEEKYGSVLQQSHNPSTSVTNLGDPRHQDQYYKLSSNIHVTFVWAANKEANSQVIIDLFDQRPPLSSLCQSSSTVRTYNGVTDPELFIAFSIGTHEIRYNNNMTYEESFEYFDTMFQALRSRCGKRAHLFFMSQPALHLWSRFVKVPASTPGKVLDLHAEKRSSWDRCMACGETTNNLSLLRQQEAALNAARQYDMVFVDLHSMTKSLRKYSKDSLHYTGAVSTSLVNLMMLAMAQQTG